MSEVRIVSGGKHPHVLINDKADDENYHPDVLKVINKAELKNSKKKHRLFNFKKRCKKIGRTLSRVIPKHHHAHLISVARSVK